MTWLRPATAAILTVTLLFAAAPNAQPSSTVHRIGVLGNQDNPPWDALRQALRALGYVEGRNVAIDWRWSEGSPDRLPALARELVSLAPDVIVASGTQAVQAARGATSTIPIVMALSQEPDKLGFVDTLARPGGNVTGLSTYSPQLMAKKLELLKEIAPDTRRVAFVWDPTAQGQQLPFRDLPAAAAAAGVTVRSIEVRRPEGVAAALAAVDWTAGDALLVVGNPITFKARPQIAAFAASRRLPSVFEERMFVDAGGLLSYGPSFSDLYRRTAIYVDKILKGARPADLPVEQPARFELVINRTTANALGLTIPASLLLRADQVIE
jgi:putative ABC transport system substrate-binding protein